ncbi:MULTISPECIES: formate dehydrogenase subunit gamma [Stutzerimonas]|jgi:formate dehydrogenase subunit gamma|uniref:NADH-quinone oxidoreductase subunit E n=1 Tax=Stutzerimonas stutzeri TaxID=316 RepID=A0A172WMQ9_STUST|nr:MULTISPECIES: formate dehydrogenase subunit gamma [Stutzerimonas]ANF24734.1 formate dehydrogenase subunit gamma [Stutzerimonas stutzeri]MCQ4282005.1 formate dehydrogenase subunit gamma [Stutzerimonas stutzeri]UNG18516.1 formate dehydrogenase subunit gamma [Stutzerimonas zhaodongensis]BAP77744.1 NADH dehydrogenase (ubiquinone) 24 kDa subunit [Pseudomonas sp. MT-1]
MAILPQRFAPDQCQAVAREVLAARRGQPGALLPILHDIQDRLGAVPPDLLPMIAEELCLSRAEVHGVVSFYHDFRASPPGRHVLKLCQAEACQSMGVKALTAELEQRLGLPLGETLEDGSLSFEAVYCLGNCACAPSAMLNGELHGRVDAEELMALLAEQETLA